MNMIEIERALRELRLSGIAETLSTRVMQAQAAQQPFLETLGAMLQDELDREPVWWYAVQFEAPTSLESFTVRNTLLTEVFGDQRNIVKFIHFPDQKQKTYSFALGEEEFEVRF